MANKPKPDTPAAKRNYLVIGEREGETAASSLARATLNPSVGAATTVQNFCTGWIEGLELMAVASELEGQARATSSGDLSRVEAILMTQAHALDTIFNSLARNAAINMGEHMAGFEVYMRLALKAQSQSRATLETLAAIKNPPTVFARQANIAHGPQQVNNSRPPSGEPSRAENIEMTQTKQSGGDLELLPDSRTSTPASGIDPPLETLGKIDRAEVGVR
jgi:hypothetical protein